MAVGTGGRIVVELDPEYKQRLYAELKRRGKTMREWLIDCAEAELGVTEAKNDIDRFLKTQSPRKGQGKRSKEVNSNITDNESAKMTTSKGTIQGYIGVATVDKKHQVIIDAQAFGEGQEHHTLKPVLERVEQRYRRRGIASNIYQQGTIVSEPGRKTNQRIRW